MKTYFMASLAVLIVAAWSAVPVCGQDASEKPLSADAIVTRNVEAAGGREKLERVKALRFQAGTQTYTASGSMLKVESALELPAVFETLCADGAAVRRNTLGRMADVAGIEAARWRLLAKVFSGCFTLERFAGALSYAGVKTFGPERSHVLLHEASGLRVEFHVDAADFLLKRLVMRGRDSDGQPWEQSGEFAAFAGRDGLMLPTYLFFSQVGVSGTYSQRPQPLGDVRVDPELPAGYFQNLDINAGKTSAEAGRMKGNILGAFFDDEELFVQIFSNWTTAEIEAAGFHNGDLLALSSNGIEFETRLFITEDQVNDPTVYAPGNSLFTHLPSRRPLFYAQFNTCAPREKFAALKAGFKLLAPLAARRK